MQKIIDWVKLNKLTAFLLIVVGWLVFRGFLTSLLGLNVMTGSPRSFDSASFNEGPAFLAEKSASSLGGVGMPFPGGGAAPAPEVEDRLVVQTSNLSLLVTDVRQISNQIIDYVDSQGGYMVETSLSHPEEAAYGMVTVRVPADNLQEILAFFRSLAIKVTSERLMGRDVTDEYVDIEARMATLNKTKVKFESILEIATEVEDILRVQREIINLQDQIDRLKGRQQYLEKTAQMAKVTIHLSTDELALPYAPTETFRPKVIFKMAVRSLIGSLRKGVEKLIWLGVYAVVWVPVLVIYILIKRYRKSKITN